MSQSNFIHQDIEIMDLQSRKSLIIMEKNEVIKQNQKFVEDLKREIDAQLQSIQKLIDSNSDSLVKINNSFPQYKDNIQNIENMDQFLQQSKIIELKCFKSDNIFEHLNQILKTMKDQILMKINELVSKINSNFQKNQQDLEYNINCIQPYKNRADKQEIKLYCQQHEGQAIQFVNFSIEQQFPKKLLCLKCFSDYKQSQKETIYDFGALLLDYIQKKITFLHEQSTKARKKEEDLQDILNNFQQKLLASCKSIQDKIQINYSKFQNQLKKIYQSTKQSLQSLNEEDVVEYINILRNQQSMMEFQKNIQKEAGNIDIQNGNDISEMKTIMQSFFEEINRNTFALQQIKPSLISDAFWVKIQKFFYAKSMMNITNIEQIYKGTRDGLNKDSFWEQVNGKTNLLMVFKQKSGYIFGGYSPCQWNQGKGYVQDDKLHSFLFSQNNDQFYPLKFDQKSQAILCNQNSGPIFGGGHDLWIKEDFQDGASKLGHTYQWDQFKNEKSKQLFGSYKPEVIECEIFKLTFLN